MNIRGIYKTSLIDFPGKISTVLFSGGCNLRCGFCHNRDLVLDHGSLEKISDDWLVDDFLPGRKKMIDGVTLTGGEPTLSDDLIPFMHKIKNLGLLVKLDTNGFNPGAVENIIRLKLADYFAVDVKTSPGNTGN